MGKAVAAKGKCVPVWGRYVCVVGAQCGNGVWCVMGNVVVVCVGNAACKGNKTEAVEMWAGELLVCLHAAILPPRPQRGELWVNCGAAAVSKTTRVGQMPTILRRNGK